MAGSARQGGVRLVAARHGRRGNSQLRFLVYPIKGKAMNQQQAFEKAEEIIGQVFEKGEYHLSVENLMKRYQGLDGISCRADIYCHWGSDEDVIRRGNFARVQADDFASAVDLFREAFLNRHPLTEEQAAANAAVSSRFIAEV